MSHFVYVLLCRGNRLYTGYATDVARRYQEHCTGKGARFTRAFPPERLLASVEFPTRHEAMHMEAEIKKMDRPGKEAWLRSLQDGGAEANG